MEYGVVAATHGPLGDLACFYTCKLNTQNKNCATLKSVCAFPPTFLVIAGSKSNQQFRQAGLHRWSRYPLQCSDPSQQEPRSEGALRAPAQQRPMTSRGPACSNPNLLVWLFAEHKAHTFKQGRLKGGGGSYGSICRTMCTTASGNPHTTVRSTASGPSASCTSLSTRSCFASVATPDTTGHTFAGWHREFSARHTHRNDGSRDARRSFC